VLTGHDLNGELQAVSEPFRQIAERLASLPLEDRLAVWEAFLCDREDRDRLILALANVDPEGTPPDQGGGEEEVSRVPRVLSSQETASSPGMSAGKWHPLTVGQVGAPLFPTPTSHASRISGHKAIYMC
jgi:hypothetical protein